MTKLGMWLDIILVSFLTLIGIAMFANSATIPAGFRQILGAGTYARSISLIFILLCLVYILNKLTHIKSESSTQIKDLPIIRDFKAAKKQLLGMWVIFILYLILIPIIGFFEAAFVFLAIGIYILGEPALKWLMQSTILSIVISIALFVIFRVFLHIYLPQRMIFRG